MNFQTSISIAISLMTVSLALPAFAEDKAVIIESNCEMCITGDNIVKPAPLTTQKPSRSERHQLRPTLQKSSEPDRQASAIDTNKSTSDRSTPKTGCQSD